MQLKFAATLALLSSCYFAQLNALDITALSSFVTPKVLTCYKCSSLVSDDCKNITQEAKTEEMIEECLQGAQGCVKQTVENRDGRKATFRECYYGSISSFITNFNCEGTQRHRLYDTVQCFKCRGNLCNKSNRINSSYGILFYTALLAISAYTLRI